MSTAVLYFFVKVDNEKKKYILRATESEEKTWLVYITDTETGKAFFNQTPRGIIKMIYQKYHPKLDFRGRSWQSIYYLGRSLIVLPPDERFKYELYTPPLALFKAIQI